MISTVFLAMDHAWGRGAPLLFETMLFLAEDNESKAANSKWDMSALDYGARCETWGEAEAMHETALLHAAHLLVDTAAALKIVY